MKSMLRRSLGSVAVLMMASTLFFLAAWFAASGQVLAQDLYDELGMAQDRCDGMLIAQGRRVNPHLDRLPGGSRNGNFGATPLTIFECERVGGRVVRSGDCAETTPGYGLEKGKYKCVTEGGGENCINEVESPSPEGNL